MHRLLRSRILWYTLVSLLLNAASSSAQYFSNSLDGHDHYQRLAGKPLTDLYTNVQSVKMCYDIASGTCYFIDSKRYPYHHDFCSEVLNYSMEIADFNAINYTMHPQRRFVLSCLNYYKDQKRYVIEFVSEDDLTAELLLTFYKATTEKLPTDFKPQLLLNNQNLLALPAAALSSVPTVTPQDIYGDQKQQSVVLGVSYGRLKLVKDLSKEMNSVAAQDVILISGSPIALPICAGIITDAMQTPLSHINVLCNNRNIPAAAWVAYQTDSAVLKLIGKPVKLTVIKSGIKLELATEASLATKQKAKPVQVLTANLTVKTIVPFTSKVKPDVKTIGNKALGFWELKKLRDRPNISFEVPAGSFAIPFYFYQQHMQHPSIKPIYQRVIALSKQKQVNERALELALKDLRKAIRNAPISKNLLAQVYKEMRNGDTTLSYRFRSSSNAEDLKGFSGAGLYESYSGSMIDTNKRIADAIRKVWASVWKLSAYRERQFYNISQSTVMMGILVHQGFPSEEANGVAITKNLIRDNFPGYTINVQIGETSVVAPPKDVVCDQLIIIPSDYFIGEEGQTYAQYISRSNINKTSNTVLTPQQIQQLYDALTQVKDYYYITLRKNTNGKSYDDYGLDIEFKFDKGKLYFKQVRPFN
jgi:pyruvate, water dikinase